MRMKEKVFDNRSAHKNTKLNCLKVKERLNVDIEKGKQQKYLLLNFGVPTSTNLKEGEKINK